MCVEGRCWETLSKHKNLTNHKISREEEIKTGIIIIVYYVKEFHFYQKASEVNELNALTEIYLSQFKIKS